MESHRRTYHKALYPPGLKAAVKNRVDYEGVDKDPDLVIGIMNSLEAELKIVWKYEEDRTAAGKGGPQQGRKKLEA